MQLEIITPEAKIFKGEVDSVQFPGMDGSFQVLNGHAPIISTLKNGTVKIDLTNDHKSYNGLSSQIVHDPSNDRVIRIDIKGGTMEMLNDKVIVLAE